MNTLRSRQIGLNLLVGITLTSISALLQAANVQWVGNTGTSPANGSISVSTPVSIYTETWPIGSAVGSRVVYSIDNGLNWRSLAMSKTGTVGNNDKWAATLGSLPCGVTVQYAVEATSPSLWDSNNTLNYRATVNTANNEICADALKWNNSSASVTVTNPATDARTYTLSSNAVRRPDTSVTNPRNISESLGKPILRTGNNLFDGLFALAYTEMANTLSVSQISDGAYNGGVPFACPATGSGGCFKTGVKWPYVWTRDSAYSVDLSLAQMDPLRAMNTLNFKISDRRSSPGKPEIVQDTGSGGSWPVSSDRVVWARGAWELLKYLDGATRTSFRDNAYSAIVNTIENDRLALYDARDGLYAGEQSFLDWREQTYPAWTATQMIHIGMSKTLSTNANHWMILNVAAQLAAEKGLISESNKYQSWATALKTALNSNFWQAGSGMYASMKTTEFDPSPLKRFELMGTALMVLDGVTDATQAATVVRGYPHTNGGAPVVWPQIRDTKIYHNQSIWPFATAYWMRAAAATKNEQVVNHNLKSLMRISALNLSQMENVDFQTLSARANDPNNPQGYGPDIDSEAQLWSVAGYMSAVLDSMFGRQATQSGIRFQPFITKFMRNGLFAANSSIKLNNLPYKGKTINVEIVLPAADGNLNGYYKLNSVSLNGVNVAIDSYFGSANLAASNTLKLQLVDANATANTMLVVPDTGDYKRFFAPKEPAGVQVSVTAGVLNVSFNSNGESGTVFNIYRNGTLVAQNLSSTSWNDPNAANYASKTLCYSVEQKYIGSFPVENLSHHSEPVCYWVAGSITHFSTGAGLNSLDAASTASDHGRLHFNNWGAPNQVLEAVFTPTVTGKYAIQTQYGNALNSINTGITACVKKIEIRNASNGLISSDVIMMPHLANWDVWGDSSVALATLTAGVSYKIQIKDFYNMSYLTSNAKYSGAGGAGGQMNNANISGLKVLRLE